MLLLCTINCRYSHSCLALFYVRQALLKHLPGVTTEIRQFTLNDPYYKTLQDLGGSGASALFFSVYIWNHHQILRLLGDLRRLLPDTPLILGGPQANQLEPLPDGCSVIQGPVEGLPGQFYQDLRENRLQRTYQAEPGHPFPQPYLPTDATTLLANRQLYYESSRGCPFTCSYCLSSLSDRVMHKDLETVRREIRSLLTGTPKIIKFVDRTFNDLPDRALAIWQFLSEQPEETLYHFEIAPDRYTPAMHDLLTTIRPGLFQFEIGVQSFNLPVLTAISRRMDTERAADTIQRLAALDTIHIHTDLILGLPEETPEAFLHSFNRLFSLGPHHIQMGLLKLLPETAIRQFTANGAILCCSQPPYEVLATRWMPADALRRLYAFGECVEAFYNTRYFRSLWQYLRARQENGAEFFLHLLDACIARDFFQRSPTPLFLTQVLVTAIAGRADQELLLDLFRFDWLRCGNHSLPDCLHAADRAPLHPWLRQVLPLHLEPFYTARERDAFIRKHTFLRLDAPALRALGLGKTNGPGLLCFTPRQTATVDRFQQAVLLPAREQ